MNGWVGKAGWACAVLGLSALAGCGAPGEGGASLGNALMFAGPTVPPPARKAVEDVYCPAVDWAEGGAALQSYAGGRAGDSAGLRSQTAISDTARECVGQADGSTVVKVGVAGHVLLGVGGAAGRYDVPVQIVVKRGDAVIANRSRRVAVTIPAGSSQAAFSVVEEGIVVPPSDAQSFEIQAGLGGGAPARRARGRRG